MKKLTVIIFCLILTTALCNGQKLSMGGGLLYTIDSYTPSFYQSRVGVEGIFEIQPFHFGLVTSFAPNLIFKDDGYNTLFSLPIEIKYEFGDRYKIYPTIGYLLRTHSFSGVSTGLGLEFEVNKLLYSGIKCNRIAGIYRHENLLAHAEISYQISAYLLHRIK